MSPSRLQLPTALKLRHPRSGHVRIPFMRQCIVAAPQGRQQGLICDISAAGAYVRLPRPLEPGTTVQLSFEIFTGEPPILVDAVVMWQNADPRAIPELPPGCGVRFVELGARDAARIGALVKAYSALPS